ncbi:MAG: xanthine dehydrogenase family protein molybdopterin-binding subunit, partial [Stellaceae bacterium]
MTNQHPSRYVGRPILRREDQRLLTGQGQFVADIVLPRMLHAVFVRSSVAHARVRAVDVSRAAAAPGVVLALNGAELARWVPPAPDAQLSLPSKWRTQVEHTLQNPQQPLLATDKVRHVGEAIAVVVAESLYAAQDAAELIEPELEPLPAVVDPEQALRAGATLVHERFGTNLIGQFSIGKGSIDAELPRSPRRLKRRFYHHRYSGIPME